MHRAFGIVWYGFCSNKRGDDDAFQTIPPYGMDEILRRYIRVSACFQISTFLCIFVQILFVHDQIIQMAFTKLLFK